MKRSSSLQRRTPLRRVAMSPRRAPLMRGNSRLGLRPPSRLRVTPEERRARKLVKKRAGGLCEARGDGPATEWHHRVRRSQGGPWSASNGMHVCSPCHEWITRNGVGAHIKGWHLRSVEDPAAEPVCRRGAWVLLADDGSMSPAPDFPIGGAR